MSAISTIASVIGINLTENPVTCGLAELDSVTGQEKKGSLQAFQYFPETISDSKSPNYAKKSVPGGSHPIKSFVDGGERTVTFTAVFTADENPEQTNIAQDLLTGNFNIGPSALFSALTGKKQDKYTSDIPGAIAWLRSFTYPEYTPTGAAKPPPLCILFLPNSGIVGNPNFPDSIVGEMVQCDVVYEAFHRNGAPRYTVVNLSFSESVQTGPNWKFVGRESFPSMVATVGSGPYKRDMIGAKRAPKTAQSAADSILGQVRSKLPGLPSIG